MYFCLSVGTYGIHSKLACYLLQLLQLLQPPVVTHTSFSVTMASVSQAMTDVMEIGTVVMAVMKMDVVSAINLHAADIYNYVTI